MLPGNTVVTTDTTIKAQRQNAIKTTSHSMAIMIIHRLKEKSQFSKENDCNMVSLEDVEKIVNEVKDMWTPVQNTNKNKYAKTQGSICTLNIHEQIRR